MRLSASALADTLIQKAIESPIGERLVESLRPHVWPWSTFWSEGVAIPIRPVSQTAMYSLYGNSDVLRPIINTLRNEIFRVGLTPRARFAVKCQDCKTEYQSKVEACENCGSDRLRKPNWLEEQKMKAWLRSVNANEQSLREVCKECEKDTEVVDDAYIVCIRQYASNGENMLVAAKEFIRADPRVMRLSVDKRGEMGGSKWICLEHRDQPQTEKGSCPRCGKALHSVHYVSYKSEGDGEPDRYFLKDEVLHWSKYDPSLTYGTPPLITLWQAGQTLKNMGNYANIIFQGQRVPRRFIWMITKNRAAFKTWWDEQKKEMDRDQGHVPIVAIEPREGAKGNEGQIGVIDAMDSLQDLQFLDHKKDLRERISAFYGVSNVFQTDVRVAGGLNNESRQIMVTDRAVEFGRGIYQDKVFPWICKRMGFKDFEIAFEKLDERDEVTRLNLEAKRIANMNGMVAAGFVAHRQADGSFIYEGTGERVRSKEPGAPEVPHMESPKPPETEREESELKSAQGPTPWGVFSAEQERTVKEGAK